MTDIFREVDEMMRRERAEAFWQKNKIPLIAAVVAIIAMTGLFSAYSHWDQGVREAQTKILIDSIEKPDFTTKAADIAAEMRPGLRGITLLTAAGTLQDQNKIPEALELYAQAAADESLPMDLRGLATLMSVRLDTAMTAEEKTKRLEGIYKDNGNPWGAYARLEAALIAASAEDFKQAQDHLTVIQETRGLPDTLYEKASALDHVYRLKAQTQKENAPEESEGEKG
jgi:hypothetical protein